MAGTSATLLAKRWESALLVNVDNETLSRLLANEEAMEALMKIEGFRSLNSDIETIINKSEKIKKAKAEDKGPKDKKEKKELSDEEKEMKSKRKQIQEKLIKFATRVPIFMYLTDFREQTLKHVITQLEPGLFKKVTGLDVKDFELLISLNVFNGSMMNDAIYKFKRYEDASLSYTGINKHEGEAIGGWDTVLKREEYEQMYYNQQATMVAPEVADDDVPDKPYVVFDIEEEAAAESPKTFVQKTAASSNVRIFKSPEPAKPAIKTTVEKPAAKAEPKPKVDLSWVKVGCTVKHKTFGEGEVIEIANGKVTVTFGKAEKKFQYPFAFENGFLTK
jgi:hypothetical protein